MSPKFEPKICRPREHLKAAGHLYPDAWKLIDQFRAGKGKQFPGWADWCFIPITAGQTVVAEDAGVDIMALPFIHPDRIADGTKLAALAAWRVTQGVYQFDPDLLANVLATPVYLDLTHEVLFQIPEWCVYIETPGLMWAGQNLHGFFAHLEADINEQRPELRLLLDGDTQLMPVPLHLGPWTMAEALDRMFAEASYHGAPVGPGDALAMWPSLTPFVSLVLYLCVEQASITDKRGRTPSRPRPKKVKGDWRLVAPDGPTFWQVGGQEP